MFHNHFSPISKVFCKSQCNFRLKILSAGCDMRIIWRIKLFIVMEFLLSFCYGEYKKCRYTDTIGRALMYRYNSAAYYFEIL